MSKFAYVRFLKDNYRAAVPMKDIKRFDSKLHEISKVYMVRWNDDETDSEGAADGDGNEYFKAQILMLADTEREVYRRLKEGPRMQIPKIRDSSVEESEDEVPLSIVQARTNMAAVTKKKAEKNAASQAGKRVALNAIMQERLSSKRKEQADVMAAPVTAESLTIKKLKLEVAKLRKEVQEVTTLNRQLQEQVINKFSSADVPIHASSTEDSRRKNVFHTFSSPSSNPSAEPRKATARPALKPLPAHQPNWPAPATPEPPTTEEASRPMGRFEAINGEVCLGDGVMLSEFKFSKISATKKNSIFVKELAVAVWGTEVLKSSSVEGKMSPRHKNVPGRVAKPALCPVKMKAVKGCFEERQKLQNLTPEEKDIELGKMKKYIGEKIQDLNKKK